LKIEELENKVSMNNSVLIKEVNDYSDKTTLEKNNDNISFDEENEIYNYQQEIILWKWIF